MCPLTDIRDISSTLDWEECTCSGPTKWCPYTREISQFFPKGNIFKKKKRLEYSSVRRLCRMWEWMFWNTCLNVNLCNSTNRQQALKDFILLKQTVTFSKITI